MHNETTTAHVVETGASAFAVKIDVGVHTLVGDEPVAMGGANLGPAPYDMLLSALGECTAMTVRWYARKHDWPVDRVEVTLTHVKIAVEGKSVPVDQFTKTISIVGDKLTAEQREKLISVAAHCPVQRTLEGSPDITTIAAS